MRRSTSWVSTRTTSSTRCSRSRRAASSGASASSEGRIRARVKPISREKPGERQAPRAAGVRTPGPEAGTAPGATTGADGGAQGAPADGRRATAARRKAARSGAVGGGGSRSGGDGAERRGESRPDAGSGAGGGTRRPAAGEHRGDHRARRTDRGAGRAAAEEFTQGLVDTFDLGARAKSVIDDDVVVVEVTGDNLGLLVGPKGATLHAIEELVRTVVQRQTDGHGVRIHVDVAGYRAKRREALEEFTRDLAEKVLESGQPQALEPMSASDRKVVHDTAAEIDGDRHRVRGRGPASAGRAASGLIRSPTGSMVEPDPAGAEPTSCGSSSRRPVTRLPRARARSSRSSTTRSSLAGAVGRVRRRTSSTSGSGGGLPGLVLAVELPDATGCCSTRSSGAVRSWRRRSRGSVSAHRVTVACGSGRGRWPGIRRSGDGVRPRGRPVVRLRRRSRPNARSGSCAPGGTLVVTEPPERRAVGAALAAAGLADLGFGPASRDAAAARRPRCG